MMERVLIVDDDVKLCVLIKEYLGREGFEIEAVHDGARGVERALSEEHALVVLDVMLPGMNGLEVLRRIRAKSRTPVLMLTARGDDIDRIVGLEIGADDYLPKPFNPRELVARIRAVLRRTQPVEESSPEKDPHKPIRVSDIVMEAGKRIVRRAGEPIDLTAVEFDFLEILLRSAGRVVKRDELVRKVLGRDLSPFDRSIDTHISNLRKKLGHEVKDVERIRTVRGVGYIYASADDVQTA